MRCTHLCAPFYQVGATPCTVLHPPLSSWRHRTNKEPPGTTSFSGGWRVGNRLPPGAVNPTSMKKRALRAHPSSMLGLQDAKVDTVHTQMQRGIRSEYLARKSWMREGDLRPKSSRLNPVHGVIQSTLLHSKRKDLGDAPDALDPLAMLRAQRRQAQPSEITWTTLSFNELYIDLPWTLVCIVAPKQPTSRRGACGSPRSRGRRGTATSASKIARTRLGPGPSPLEER